MQHLGALSVQVVVPALRCQTLSWTTISCFGRGVWSGAADHEGSRLHEVVGLDAVSETSQEMEAGARDNLPTVVMRRW